MLNSGRGILTVVSGFAGSGKGTVMKKLIAEHDNYALSVSATSRKPRPGEEEGVSYFFRTREEFEEMIRGDKLLEYAEYVGNYYGTPKEFVFNKMDEGRDVILEIELQGAMQIKEKYPETLLIFLTPPDADELYKRLKGRGTETEEVIAKRMKRAAEEALCIKDYDYLVINDNIDACTERVHNIIQVAHRTVRHEQDIINRIQTELTEKMRA
ncbi:MAG: guanylate kinase [Lachnospiraceae bacterium]|nr:guanylate kinase [Lachnospiraceae bacterium]MBQ9607037.1 guanylate kinase [Lachnospiraceae bacterium]MBR1524756.1 guanylate kinase [Lachnospiraceae bacterium]